MLIHWQSHQEYLYFLHETKVHLDSSQRTRLRLEFDTVQKKLKLLNLDSVMEYLSLFYSPTGRPALLIGCTPDSLPPPSSYFDFIDRLWTQPEAAQKTDRMDLFPKDKNLKLSKKPGKGKKLPNKHAGITDSMAVYALSHEEFPFHYEERLLQFFRLAALLPAAKLTPAPAKSSVHRLPMAAVSTQNRTGMSSSIRLCQGVRKNIKRFTTTALPVKG